MTISEIHAERRIWHPLLAAAARPASAHIAHVLCALNRRRIRCRQSEGWLRYYRTPTRPGIRAGCGSLAALARHRLMVTADPRPLVGSIHVAVARKCTVFRLPAGGAVRQGSRSSRSRRAGTGHYLPQPSSHRFHLAKAGLLPAGYRVVASVVEMPPRLGLLVHHGDRELAVVEMLAELITVAEDRDLQRVQRVGTAV